jgi:hypothetical protein
MSVTINLCICNSYYNLDIFETHVNRYVSHKHIIACARVISKILSKSKVTFQNLQHLECLCSCIYQSTHDLNNFNKELFPMLTKITMKNITFKGHQLDKISPTAKIYYHLLRNQDKLKSTIALYLCIRQKYTLDRNVLKMICNRVLCLQDWPESEEESQLMRKWRADTSVARLRGKNTLYKKLKKEHKCVCNEIAKIEEKRQKLGNQIVSIEMELNMINEKKKYL